MRHSDRTPFDWSTFYEGSAMMVRQRRGEGSWCHVAQGAVRPLMILDAAPLLGGGTAPGGQSRIFRGRIARPGHGLERLDPRVLPLTSGLDMPARHGRGRLGRSSIEVGPPRQFRVPPCARGRPRSKLPSVPASNGSASSRHASFPPAARRFQTKPPGPTGRRFGCGR